MSKQSKKKRRENTQFANRRLPLRTLLPSSPYSTASLDAAIRTLREIEDRREWHPEGIRRPARSINQSRHRLVSLSTSVPRPNRDAFASLRTLSPQRAAIVAFSQPETVATCVRRKQRQEILHAKRKTGKSGQKKPRWTEYSRVACKR